MGQNRTIISINERKLGPSEISTEILKQLDGVVHRGGAMLVGSDGEQVLLPDSLNELLLYIVEAVKRKQTIFLMPEDEAFTTQAAANFLGVSRPYLLRLLEAQKLPFHRVGTHRRILFKDLISYQRTRSLARNGALTEMTKMLDEAGVYDRVMEHGE